MTAQEKESVQNQIEEMRARLQTGRHGSYDGLALRCLLFYGDVKPLIQQGAFALYTTRIDGLCEVFHSTALVVSAFGSFADSFKLCDEREREARRGMQLLTMFGLVQAVTQTIEAISHICDLLHIPNEVMKTRNYWAFRNRLNHVLLGTKKSSTRKWETDLPLNEFKIMPGSIDTISYKSSGAQGYAVDHMKMSRMVELLQFDLKPVFEAIIKDAALRVAEASSA